MHYIVIGSHAAKAAGVFVEKPNDLDLIADYDSAVAFLKNIRCTSIYPINKGKTLVGKKIGQGIIEISIAWPGTTNEEILKLVPHQGKAPLNLLYMLKMSHRYLKDSPHFYKTMRDIRKMRNMGAIIQEDHMDLYRRRMKETYDYGLPKLNQSKANFFSGDGVEYKYDHDTIHEAVAMVFGVPMYKHYQKEGSEVAVDRSKWEALLHKERIIAVAEECAVLALERSLVPFPGAKTPFEAFKLALMKVCTSITSGWFREFAWENHDEVLEMVLSNTYNFVGLFEAGLAKGIVKEHKA